MFKGILKTATGGTLVAIGTVTVAESAVDAIETKNSLLWKPFVGTVLIAVGASMIDKAKEDI